MFASPMSDLICLIKITVYSHNGYLLWGLQWQRQELFGATAQWGPGAKPW